MRNVLLILKKVGIFASFTFLLYISIIGLVVLLLPENYIQNMNIKYPIGGYGFMNSRLKDVQAIKNIDILFLGGSATYRSFDPEGFEGLGLKTFNLGSTSQTPLQTLFLLEKYLDQLNPKKVIWAVAPIAFEGNGLESTVDIIANHKLDWGVASLVIKTNHIIAFNTFFYGVFSRIIGRHKGLNENYNKGLDSYIAGTGFVERELRYIQNWSAPEERYYRIKEKQIKAFEECISLLEEKKIEILLLQIPITHLEYNSYENNKDMDSLFKKYSRYINFNNIAVFDDKKDFYDYTHMNALGVKKFNKMLVDTLIIEWPEITENLP